MSDFKVPLHRVSHHAFRPICDKKRLSGYTNELQETTNNKHSANR